MRRPTLIAVVIALSISFLPMANGQRRRDYNALDKEKFNRVIDRLRNKGELLELNRGALSPTIPDRRRASRFCQDMIGPVYKGAGRLVEQARADLNCELTVGWDAEVTLRLGNGRLQSKHFERKHIDLEELNAPFRLFEIARTPGQLQLFYQDPGVPTALWLVQSDEQIWIVFIEGPKAVRYSAASFSQLAMRYDLSHVAEKARGFGFELDHPGLSFGLHDLLGRVLEFSDEEFADFKERWSSLESTDYDTRNSATEELRQDFDKWSAAVAFAALGYGPSSVQFKASLNQVFTDHDAENATIDAFDHVKSLVSGRLTEDPSTLIRRLKTLQTDNADQTASIQKTIRQLEKVTGQNFGTDLPAWQKWLVEFETAANDNSSDEDESNPDYGRYATARTSLSKLINLTVGDKQKWQVNQKAWQQALGADDIQELFAETVKRYQQTRLPPSWLRMGSGFDTDYVDFPQVLFERYKEHLEQPVRFPDDDFSDSFNRATFNRVLESYGLTARLDMHPQTKGRDNFGKQYLSLNIHDPTSRESRLRLFESDGQCSLLLRSGPRNELLWLFQDKDGSSWIHHATASGLTSRNAATGQKLFDENKDMFTGSAYRLFAEMGVDVSAAVGGPLAFEDVPMKIQGK